jgi:multidrug resistance efflux pump
MMSIAKRVLLGVRTGEDPGTLRLKVILLGYGICATVYRLALLISIAALLAGKVFLLGILFALVYLGVSVVGSLRRLMQYLWHSPETQMVRPRAIALGVLILVVAPAFTLFAPIPSSVYADAVVCAEQESVVRAGAPGFLRTVCLNYDDRVEEGTAVARLENIDAQQMLAQYLSDLRASHLLRDAYRVLDPVRGVEEELRQPALEQAAAVARENVDRLVPRAPRSGRVMGTIDATQVGRYLQIGDPLALIVSGPYMVRAILPESQLVRMAAREGDVVQFRTPTAPQRELSGVVVRIAPAGSRTVAHASITQLGGGDTVVDPRTMESDKAHFEVLIQLEPEAEQFVRYGAGGTVRISAHTETLGKGMIRRALRFWSQLYQ